MPRLRGARPALLAGPYVEHLPHHTHGMMCARLGSSLLYS